MTLLAIDVWFHATTITDGDVNGTLTNSEYLYAKFMTRNPWVTKERHFPKVPTVVSPTDTDCFNANKRFAGLKIGWLRYFYHCPFARFYKLKCLHEIHFIRKGEGYGCSA
jgi:hypothetical protein